MEISIVIKIIIMNGISYNIKSKVVKKYKTTSHSNHNLPIPPNLLKETLEQMY